MSEHIYEDSDMEHERYHIIPFGSMREEIVRCGDCRWRLQKGTRLYCDRDICAIYEIELGGFCAWGERDTQ